MNLSEKEVIIQNFLPPQTEFMNRTIKVSNKETQMWIELYSSNYLSLFAVSFIHGGLNRGGMIISIAASLTSTENFNNCELHFFNYYLFEFGGEGHHQAKVLHYIMSMHSCIP